MVKKVENKKEKPQEVIEMQNRISELENNHKRALADYQNQQRRHQEHIASTIKMANAALIEKLLLNIDSLQLAQKHLHDRGLQMVIDQFFDTLSDEGLKKIETDGQNFDPITMDCTEIVPGEKDKVIETISDGYYLSDKVLRPAKVKVGSGSVLRVPEPNP